MEKLPSEITLDIFYRIPAETLVQCKFVCKSWYNIILYGDGSNGDANYFANMHLHRHNQLGNNLEHSTLNFIAMYQSRHQEVEQLIEFHIKEYDGNDDLLSCKRINFPVNYNFIHSGWKIGDRRLAGSCNGLICLPRKYGITYLEDAIAICNPLLKEYVTLPLSDTHFQTGSVARRDIRLGRRPTVHIDQYQVTIGFGYHPGTDEYKVVRVDYGHYSDPNIIGDVQVYTLGNKSINGGIWRSRGTIDYCLVAGHCRVPVLMNGSLHWLASKRMLRGREVEQIVLFDLEVEEFHMIPIPHFPPFAGIGFLAPTTQLLELRRGCLCLIRTGAHKMDIWVLKDYMNKESWVKEFRMEWEGKPWCYSPCAIKKKNGTDGDHEILLWCNGKSGLVSYDTKTRNFEDVGGGVDVVGARRAVVCCNSLDPVHHIHSLVSLKALGEESSKNKGRWTRKRKRIVEGSWTRRHKLIRNIIVKAKASAYREKLKKENMYGTWIRFKGLIHFVP